jgi:hypothetical protein
MGMIVRALLLLIFLSVPGYLFLSHFAAFEPYLYPLHLAQGAESASGTQLFGPYPDHSTLQHLQQRGYRTVVSLLSPDIVYERSLIELERANAKSLGIRYYDFPMHSDEAADSPLNAAALTALNALLRSAPDSPTYIHCYLGKHRSRIAQDWLEGHRSTVAHTAP